MLSRAAPCTGARSLVSHPRARVGVLGRRGFALETAAARVCREAGGRVMTNMFVRELDLAPGVNTTDGRRLEVVADGVGSVPGSSVGHGHHIGVGSARRRHSTPPCSHGHQVQLWMIREHERRPPVSSSLARVPGPTWSSWLQKSADVEQHSSLVRWRRP